MSEPNIVTTQGVVDALTAWVSSTLAGHTYPAPDGTYKEVRVFTHNLPEPEGDDDADLAFCPFCIVHAGSGTVEDWGRQTMPIVLLTIGCNLLDTSVYMLFSCTCSVITISLHDYLLLP